MAVALAGQAGVAYENARHVSRLEHEVAERTRIQDRMDFALAAARMGIAETDLDTGRVVWSDSTAALFGISPDSFAGTAEAFYALVHPDDRAALREEFAMALRDGARDLVTEFRTIWPDGTTRWLQTRARIAYDPEGRPLRVVDVSLDVTDRKLLEAQFRQAQKMEAIGLLGERDRPRLQQRADGHLRLFRVSAGWPPRRAAAERRGRDHPGGRPRRGTDADSCSRSAASRCCCRRVSTSTRSSRTSARCSSGSSADHIELTTALDPTLSAVRADAGQLEQVLINLVVNARDAMAAGGRITIATTMAAARRERHDRARPREGGRLRRHSPSATRASAWIRRRKNRMFEPFFTTKAPGKGTGLGLAAVHGIVTQSGGYVAVESEPLHGTSFKVYLPAAEPELETAPSVARISGTAAGETASVLIVEDEPAGQDSYPDDPRARGLPRPGRAPLPPTPRRCSIGTAGGIDLLVTDVALPDGSGPALFNRLCEKRPSLRVLYMSGYADGTLVDQGALDPAGGLLAEAISGRWTRPQGSRGTRSITRRIRRRWCAISPAPTPVRRPLSSSRAVGRAAGAIGAIVGGAMSLPRPRSVVERMAGYTPGEQPKPGERVIKLNTNENPFPPSPRVVDAIRRITPDALRRYPSPMADDFRAVAARVHGVSPECILAGNGSDDILQIALRSYCGPATCWPARIRPTRSTPCSRSSRTFGSYRCPGSPAGGCRSRRCCASDRARFSSRTPTRRRERRWLSQMIEALARATEALVLVDEAYADFADDNCLSLLGATTERARHAHVQQGLRAGRPAVWLRHRRSGGDRADGQGQGQLQLRRDCHRGSVRRARRSGVRARELAGDSSRTRETLRRSSSAAASRSSRARRISCW